MKIKKPNFRQFIEFPKKFFLFFRDLYEYTFSFIILLLVYIITGLIMKMCLSKIVPLPFLVKNQVSYRANKLYSWVVKRNHLNEYSINRTNLIQLAIYNMQFKKSRTFITVGGMAIGIAAIVFLVSIGYGVQELVISRVARLDEMKQATLSMPVGGNVRINDKTVAQLKEISDIDKILPQIGAVGRVNYNNSVSDIVVYGVTGDYLQQSAVKPSSGKIFDSNELSMIHKISPSVAGASIEKQIAVIADPIKSVKFTIEPTRWLRVRSSPNAKSELLGYTRRVEGTQNGTEVWGNKYEGNLFTIAQTTKGEELNQWIKSKVKLWKQFNGNYEPQVATDQSQIESEGYIAKLNMMTENETYLAKSSVLGATTTKTTPSVLQASSDTTVDFIEEASDSAQAALSNVKKVALTGKAKKEVVVNRSTLSILGLTEEQAINKTITLSFIIVGDLLNDPSEKIESIPTEYKIVAVTPDDKTPVLYVPFIDLRSMGVENFSQIKVVSKSKQALAKIRTQIEGYGYTTQSVVDTVSQINSLFETARTVLFLVGMAALAVASLGMFNTLTVSLLERTREVGLMKAMGMRSQEVHELFLTESMILGLFGGILGLILGMGAGYLSSFAISIYAVSQGSEFISITYTPPAFIFVILFLSLLVGLCTGFYPARHATKISALNALRYE